MNEELENRLRSEGFEPIELIGSGGFGSVYKVTWARYPKQIFAAKLIHLDENVSVTKKQSYYAEIESLRRLYHPNIIFIYKYFEIGEYLVIILEYCPNGTLKQYIKKNGPLNPSSFLIVAKQCLSALYKCHSKGICHLDIKPENIMLNESFNVKLADFGLAIFASKDEKINKVQGSELYFSPERFLPSSFDPKMADVWSLGVTFYYLLFGKMPWIYNSESDLIFSIISDGITFDQFDFPEIKILINQMLDKNPAFRKNCLYLMNSKIFKEGYLMYDDDENDLYAVGAPQRASSLIVRKQMPISINKVQSDVKMPISFANSGRFALMTFQPKGVKQDIAKTFKERCLRS